MTVRRTALFALAFLTASAPVLGAQALDPAPWDRVLAAHVSGGRVDYAALASDDGARADLDRFLEEVASMPEDAPLADWLNAYNATVVKSIVEHWPLESVRDVEGFFDRARHRIAGRSRTLDDVENRIIRPRFRDARVHMALNCGARSCPPLAGRAFRQDTLDSTLDRLARSVVASSHHVRRERGALLVSEIFVWFHEDFERDAGLVLAWLRRYGRQDAPDGTSYRPLPYDWHVNARAAR